MSFRSARKATRVTPPAVVAADGTDVDPRPQFGNNKLGAATGELSDAQGYWSSTMVSAQDSSTKDTDTVVVFTDIAAPKTEPFHDVFTVNDNNELPVTPAAILTT